MRNLHKLLLPVILFGLPLILMSCQSVSANDSSVIEETAADIQADTCADLALEPVTAEQFDTAPQWVRDWLVRADAAWAARCE